MKQRHKDFLIAFVTFIGGFYFFLEFLLPGIIQFIWPGSTFEGFLRAVLPASALPRELIAGEKLPFSMVHDKITKGIQVVGAMAIGLGIINILRVHGMNILKSRKGWGNSVALLIGLFAVFGFEIIDAVNAEHRSFQREQIDNLVLFLDVIEKDHNEKQTDPKPRVQALTQVLDKFDQQAKAGTNYLNLDFESSTDRHAAIDFVESLKNSRQTARELEESYASETSAELAKSLKMLAEKTQALSMLNYEATTAKRANVFIFESFFTPLGSAMFSLLAFYIATAAYRSFRIRSLEALIMMVPAIIVMLGQIPHGKLYVHEDLPMLRAWLLENISTPAFRAITFGSLIAGLAMAVRMWLSLEKSPLSADNSMSSEGADGGRA